MKLDPNFFDEEGQPLPQVKEVLLDVVGDIIEDLKSEMDIDLPVSDVIFTGSLFSAQWDELSDIDLHIVVDYSEYNDQEKELMKDFLSYYAKDFNHEDYDLQDRDLEIYFQDKDEFFDAPGIYSLKKNDWVKKPTAEYIEITQDMKDKAKAIKEKTDQLEKEFKSIPQNRDSYKNFLLKVTSFYDEIKEMRRMGFAREGLKSAENQIFKLLRRNGSLDKLGKLMHDSRDDYYDVYEARGVPEKSFEYKGINIQVKSEPKGYFRQGNYRSKIPGFTSKAVQTRQQAVDLAKEFIDKELGDNGTKQGEFVRSSAKKYESEMIESEDIDLKAYEKEVKRNKSHVLLIREDDQWKMIVSYSTTGKRKTTLKVSEALKMSRTGAKQQEARLRKYGENVMAVGIDNLDAYSIKGLEESMNTKSGLEESIEQDLFQDVMGLIGYFLTDEKELVLKKQSKIKFNVNKMRKKNQDEKIDTLMNRVPQLIKAVNGKSNSGLEKIIINLLKGGDIEEEKLEVDHFSPITGLGLGYTQDRDSVFLLKRDIEAEPKELKHGQEIDAEVEKYGGKMYARHIVPLKKAGKTRTLYTSKDGEMNIYKKIDEIENMVDQLPGGLGDNLSPDEVNPAELAMGIEIEMEHTDDQDLAREIAMDHLAEIPDYYTRLKEMEAKAKEELAGQPDEANEAKGGERNMMDLLIDVKNNIKQLVNHVNTLKPKAVRAEDFLENIDKAIDLASKEAK